MTDEYQSAIDRCKAAREQFDAAFDEVKRLRPDESSTKEAREAEYDAHVQWILDYERGLLPEQEKFMWPDEVMEHHDWSKVVVRWRCPTCRAPCSSSKSSDPDHPRSALDLAA